MDSSKLFSRVTGKTALPVYRGAPEQLREEGEDISPEKSIDHAYRSHN